MNSNAIEDPAKKVNWLSVIVYYVLACAFSWPFFWWRDMNPESWQAWHIPGFLKNWSIMWGPGLSALICFFIFRKSHVRTVGLLGSSKIKSLLFYFLPMLALTIPGVSGMGIDNHLAPLLLCVFGFISILGEELGWRGFLQDALRPLKQTHRYIVIGVMWELWHFTNRMGHGELIQIVIRVSIFMVVTILLSWLIGKATDKSKSLMIAVTMHSWVDMLFEFSSMGTYIVFALSVPFWIYMIMTWDKRMQEKG